MLRDRLAMLSNIVPITNGKYDSHDDEGMRPWYEYWYLTCAESSRESVCIETDPIHDDEPVAVPQEGANDERGEEQPAGLLARDLQFSSNDEPPVSDAMQQKKDD